MITINKQSVNFALFFIVLMVVSAVATAAHNIDDACQVLNTVKEIKKIQQHPSQLIVIKSLGGIKANMTLCQRQRTRWHAVFTPSFNAVIGEKGIAAFGKKKEGDLKTPAGLYPIGKTFGTQPLALKMDYNYITADDKFIDDVNHKKYNTWVSGPTDAKSYESMLTKSYIVGAVINYNRNPTVAGAGSAIFIHIWRSPNTPTLGCIALEKKHVLMLLHWLDKAQHPYVFVY